MTNGCGAEGSVIDPPDLRFSAICNEHDLAYAQGGSSRERRRVDMEFRRLMIRKAKAAPWHKAAYLYPSAWGYWAGVRLFGWRHWGK